MLGSSTTLSICTDVDEGCIECNDDVKIIATKILLLLSTRKIFINNVKFLLIR